MMQCSTEMHTHTHNRFMALFPETTRVSRCQKRTSGLCGAREDKEADKPPIRLRATPSRLTSGHFHHPPILFTGRMPFLLPNQQCQSTEGKSEMHITAVIPDKVLTAAAGQPTNKWSRIKYKKLRS